MPLVHPRPRDGPHAEPHASWLSERVLLAVAPDPPADGDTLEVVYGGERSRPLATKALSLVGQMRSDGFAESGALILIRFPDSPHPDTVAEHSLIRWGRTTVAWRLPRAFADLRSLCRSRFAALTPGARDAVLAFLVESLEWDLPPPDKVRLATSLREAREALRERLPRGGDEGPDRPGLYGDKLVRIDDVSFYATGAMEEGIAALGSLVAVSPEGSRTELAGRLYRRAGRGHVRRDASAVEPARPSGFAAYFSLPAPSLLPEGWTLELRGTGASACEAPLPLVDGLAVSRRVILDHLVDGPVDDRVMEDHVFPALSRLQARQRSGAIIDRVVECGPPVTSAQVSVLITFDQGITMLEHQLAQFASDPEIRQADLIYVLDSESPADGAIEAAALLYEIYRVPFRLVTLAHQRGFAAATDAAVSLARGRLVIFLGSSVLPDRSGWIAALAGFHDARETVGALGATLLGPDDAVRHAGFRFVRAPGTARWQLQPRSAGRRRRTAAVNRAARVPAVSASCLMIDRARLERAGGLSGKYVQRDFEAADLCLRLTEAGHEIWVCPAAMLYDLDQQRTDRASRAAQIYDEWVCAHAWRAQLDALVS